VGDCPSKLRILNEEGCLMRPRLSPEDQDLGSSATLYCYREQSGGGGGHAAASTEQENCGIDIDYRNVKDLHTTNSVEGA
jgi:hypothetical protein